MNERLGRLPSEPADLFTKPFMRFLRIEAMAGGVLLLCTVLAVALSNSPWSPSFLSIWEMPAGIRIGSLELSRSLKQLINDGLMTMFFFVVALELKREMVLGELRDLRRAFLSLAAASGGMIVPAGLFLLVAFGGAGQHGWGTVMATDTAFMIGGLAILGSRVPQSLRVFLLSLAIFDDIGAVLVVAVGYGATLNWVALGLAGLGFAGVAGISRLGVRSIAMYVVFGAATWLALDRSGIHPTVVGLVLGLMTPARSWVSHIRLRAILDRIAVAPPDAKGGGDKASRKDLRRASVAAREAISRVEQLELLLHPWIAFAVMPLFALANAGLNITPANIDGTIALAVFVGLVFGKPIGVLLFAWLAVSLGLAKRSVDLTWSVLAAGAMLTGIGFTMALFIAQLAFSPGLLDSAKFGILAASLASATSGLLALVWLTSPRHSPTRG